MERIAESYLQNQTKSSKQSSIRPFDNNDTIYLRRSPMTDILKLVYGSKGQRYWLIHVTLT